MEGIFPRTFFNVRVTSAVFPSVDPVVVSARESKWKG